MTAAELWLLWHHDVLSALPLRVRLDGQDLRKQDGRYVQLEPNGATIQAQPGQFERFLGSYHWPGAWTFEYAKQSVHFDHLGLHSDGLTFRLIDAQERLWLAIGAGHPQMAADGSAVVLSGAELRIGQALADWMSQPEIEGQPLGMVLGRLKLEAAAPAEPPKGCTTPIRWPGTLINPGNPALGVHRADLRLLTTTQMRFLRCRQIANPSLDCDGPGGTAGEVALALDAQLRNSDNADSADIPWYPKFLGQFPPYDNDQHPFLIWNLYREDSDGYLLQIGRSGLKHAFVTINNGCQLGCPPPPPANANHVLYRNCSDVYSVATNDTNEFIGPRAELVPASGIWGRCGSIFDADCDGQADPVNHSPYQYRLVVSEDQIDPAANIGARYFQDAWYIVRDDVDIDNSMGTRELTPSFGGGLWNLSFVDSELVHGPMLQRWLQSAGTAELTRISRVRTAQGEIAIAARVREVSPGLWRYRYVLANLDYALATLSGSNPNIRVDSERGLSALRIPHAPSAPPMPGFRDGNPLSDDWVLSTELQALLWTAPNSAAELRWGNLLSVGFDSDAAPGHSAAAITLGGTAGPQTLSMQTLIAGAELLADGFE